jgi:hypothetical protein
MIATAYLNEWRQILPAVLTEILIALAKAKRSLNER